MHSKDRFVPTARKEDLIVKELEHETLVYDKRNDKAHCLNQTAALVWKYCDGRTDMPTMARLLELEIESPVPEETVRFAIKQLEESGLLSIPLQRRFQLPQTSRRELGRRLGIAAVALPLITSIEAPTVAQVCSNCDSGQ